MLAGFFAGPGHFSLREHDEPRLLEPDDVIVEVEVAGLCGTDLHIVSTPQLHPASDGIVLGHEFVGRVVELGAGVLGLRPGQRVIAGPNISCGQCEACRRGRLTQCCNNRTLGISCDGGFARFVRAPARVLYPISDALAPELAVFAEPLSCCVNGLRRVSAMMGPLVGMRVLVQGAGPIGQYFTRLLRHAGASTILTSDPLAHRRQMAVDGGADHALDPGDAGEFELAVRELCSGGPDIVVDTVGSLLPEALSLVRAGGSVLVFGMDQTCSCAVSPFDLVRNEKSVIGCFVDNAQIPRCLDMIPALGLDRLISHRLPLADIDTALNALADATAIKALVYPGSRRATDAL